MFVPINSAARCGRIPAGTFLFLDGFTKDNKYVCLRRRPGSDCWYFKSNVIGENFELAPGRTIAQGNKGVTCAAWQAAFARSVSALENDRKTIFAGSPNAAAQTRTQLCLYSFRSAQEMARRITAIRACPQISPELAKYTQEYATNVEYARENCIMKE